MVFEKGTNFGLRRTSHSAHGARAPGLAPRGASRPLGARPPRGSKKKLKGKEVDGQREKDENEGKRG